MLTWWFSLFAPIVASETSHLWKLNCVLCSFFSFLISISYAFTFKFVFIFSCYQLSFLPLLSGETKKCLGASVLWGPRAAAAAAEGQDERWWAAGADEEAPEGSRPPAQTHPESRRPPSLSIVAHLLLLLLTPAFSRLGISMLLEQYHTSHSHAWRQPKRGCRSTVVMHAFTV